MGQVFGQMNDQGPTDADPDGGLSGGQLFARKAVKGTLAGAGNALQQENGGGGVPPVDFNKLMTPQRRKLPTEPLPASSLYGD